MLDRAVVVLVLLCALLSTVAAASGPLPAAASVGTAPEHPSTNVEVLQLDSSARTTISEQSMDVGTALAAQQHVARARLDRHALAVNFEQIENEQARREFLIQAATDVEIDISELRTEQRDLRSRFVAGEITTATFLSQQMIIDARAGQLRRDLELIREYAGRVPRLSMNSRVASLQASLTGIEGPITTRVETAATGEEPPILLYVATSTNGTALAMIDDDQYVRQSFRSDHWIPDSSRGVPLSDVEDRAGELYPVAFNPPQVTSRGIGNVPPEQTVDTGIYRIDIGYRQGEIVAYLDGDTENVFYETQRQPLDLIVPPPAVTVVDNGTRLAVNRTFVGGPLRIAVADNSTGDPVNTNVFVEDVEVATGADGVAWALMPAETARVTAVTQSGNATLLVGTNQSMATGAVSSSTRSSRPAGAEP